MKPTPDPIVAKAGQNTVSGSYGTLLVDATTGIVLQYNMDELDSYADIVKFDVAEYAAYNGGMDDTDISLIGFWTDKGEYVPPDLGDRECRGEEITLRWKEANPVNPSDPSGLWMGLFW